MSSDEKNTAGKEDTIEYIIIETNFSSGASTIKKIDPDSGKTLDFTYVNKDGDEVSSPGSEDDDLDEDDLAELAAAKKREAKPKKARQQGKKDNN